jgi:hypothetical protein
MSESVSVSLIAEKSEYRQVQHCVWKPKSPVLHMRDSKALSITPQLQNS